MMNDFRSLNKNSKVLIIGGASMIGSALIYELNKLNIFNIDVCDNLCDDYKWLNIKNLKFNDYIQIEDFFNFLKNDKTNKEYDMIFDFYENDDKESNISELIRDNYTNTCKIANWAIQNKTKFIYISNYSTYGNEFPPCSDNDKDIVNLIPNDKYTFSKHLTDVTFYRSEAFKRFGFVGLKFSNLFGPNEYYKKDKSLIYRFYKQIKENGSVILSRDQLKTSYDFIYIKESVKMLLFLSTSGVKLSGMFNISSGKSYTLKEIVEKMFNIMNKDVNIKYSYNSEKMTSNCLDNQKLLSNGYRYEEDFERDLKDCIPYYEKNKFLGELM